MLLPVIVFAVGCLLAFATGTSWGTFGILIPIVQNVFEMSKGRETIPGAPAVTRTPAMR